MQLKQDTELQNGKYRIVRVLGQGGFGITYLAENVLLERRVAIKEFFPKDFCGRDITSHLTIGTENNRETVEKLKARFLKEARNIARLNHPGIVRVFDVFEENDTAYYVMEYIHGENLNEIVKRNGPLPEDKAIRYVSEVGEVLEYIHSKNMTHFDVKPANIIIRKEDDKPILIDFGLSKQYDSYGEATSTMMQAVSHGYSPIELYNAGSVSEFSPQIDVYSLAATLYFLVVGKVPPTSGELINQDLSFSGYIHPKLKSVIISGMQVSKLKRIDTISTFLTALTNCQDNTKISNDIGIEKSTNIIIERPNNDTTSVLRDNEGQREIRLPIVDIKKTPNPISKIIIFILVFPILTSIVFLLYINRNSQIPNETQTSYDKMELIDLGLPSKTLWCKNNYGNKSDDDYFYFNHKKEIAYCTPYFVKNEKIEQGIAISAESELSKFKKLGYSLPSDSQFKELIELCNWEWANQDGHYGYLITGPNNNSIFLPANGYVVRDHICYDNENGSYWIGNDFTLRLCFSKTGGVEIDKNLDVPMSIRLVKSYNN